MHFECRNRFRASISRRRRRSDIELILLPEDHMGRRRCLFINRQTIICDGKPTNRLYITHATTPHPPGKTRDEVPSHKSILVSCLLLTFTRNPSCLTNQSLYTVHSASFSAISMLKRSTNSEMSLFISMSDMFLPKQVRGPRPNYCRQPTLASLILLASLSISRR